MDRLVCMYGDEGGKRGRVWMQRRRKRRKMGKRGIQGVFFQKGILQMNLLFGCHSNVLGWSDERWCISSVGR